MFLAKTPLSLKLEQESEPGLLTGALDLYQTRIDGQNQANSLGLQRHPHRQIPLSCCCPDAVVAAAPPGKDNYAGEVKAVACYGLDGCVVRVSISVLESYDVVRLKGTQFRCRGGPSSERAILEREDRRLGLILRGERILG